MAIAVKSGPVGSIITAAGGVDMRVENWWTLRNGDFHDVPVVNMTVPSLKQPNDELNKVYRTLKIVERCKFGLDELKYDYPDESGGHGGTPQQRLESLVWNGSTWALKTVPVPKSATDAWLYGVSCVSTAFCLAVGDYKSTPTDQPTLAETWNGTAWALVPSQSSSVNPANSLAGASCNRAPPAYCLAVGNSLSREFTYSSLGGYSKGSSFTLTPTPDSGPKGDSDLRGVYCVSPLWCMAVGTMAAYWNGTSWKSVAFPQASPVVSIAYGVSCTSQQFCTAVGTYQKSPVGSLALMVYWDGKSWQQQAVQNP